MDYKTTIEDNVLHYLSQVKGNLSSLSILEVANTKDSLKRCLMPQFSFYNGVGQLNKSVVANLHSSGYDIVLFTYSFHRGNPIKNFKLANDLLSNDGSLALLSHRKPAHDELMQFYASETFLNGENLKEKINKRFNGSKLRTF